MKKFLFILICLILLLCSCSNSNYYEVTSNSSKQEYVYSESQKTYVANIESLTYHLPNCRILKSTKEENKLKTTDIDFLTSRGFKRCKTCMNW